MDIDQVSIVIRALSFIALLQAAGAALFMAIFATQLQQAAWLAIDQLSGRAAIVGMVLVLLHHGLEAGRMAGEFSGVMYGSLQRMTLHSSVAWANLLRLVGLAIIALSMHRRGEPWRIARWVAAGSIAASFIVTGHTTVYPPRWLLALSLMLHVLIVAFWFGSLLPLYVVVRNERPISSSRIVAAFSALATACVPIIAVAGGVLAWLLLPNWRALREPYGLLLLVKVSGFVVLLALAALNKWRLAPILEQPRAAAQFGRIVLWEYALICGVLSATAAMTGLFSPE